MKLAAEQLKATAAQLVHPTLSEKSVICMMRIGVGQVLHEVQMALIEKKSVSTKELFEMFKQQQQALDALTEGK